MECYPSSELYLSLVLAAARGDRTGAPSRLIARRAPRPSLGAGLNLNNNRLSDDTLLLIDGASTTLNNLKDAREASEKTANELAAGPGSTPDQLLHLAQQAPNTRLSKFSADEDIELVVEGSEAGKCTGFSHGWLPRSIGSIPVS